MTEEPAECYEQVCGLGYDEGAFKSSRCPREFSPRIRFPLRGHLLMGTLEQPRLVMVLCSLLLLRANVSVSVG